MGDAVNDSEDILLQDMPSTSAAPRITSLGRQVSTLVKDVMTKSGEVQIRDSNSIRKFIFKNWKPAFAELTKDKFTVWKDSAKDKVKFEISLAQSYTTYPLIGTPEERATSVFIHTAKGDEQYFKVATKEEAKQWITALKNNTKLLDNNLMKELQYPSPPQNFEDRALKMGWVREKSPILYWRWRYLIMTDVAAYLYDKAPSNSSQLGTFAIKYLLFETKQKDLDPADFPEAEEESIKYAFAILAQRDSSFVATETRNETKNWLNALKAMSLSAVKKIEDFTFSVTVPDEKEPSTLAVKRSKGFILTGPQNNEVFNHPFSRFKQFKIDKKSIFLDFGKFSEKIIELQTPDATRISIVISLLLETLVEPPKAPKTN